MTVKVTDRVRQTVIRVLGRVCGSGDDGDDGKLFRWTFELLSGIT